MPPPAAHRFDPRVFTVFDTVYTAVAGIAAAGAIPYGFARSSGDPQRRRRFRGRLGFVKDWTDAPAGGFLLHGVSVGEVKLVAPLLAAAAARGVDVRPVVSSTTPAGIAEAERQYPALPRVVFPSEFPGCAARFLDALRPRAAALLEVELWPAFLRSAAVRDLPVMILNGRISERSARRYSLLLEYTSRRLAGIRFFGMQSQEYAERMVKLGADPASVCVCGNVKFDGLPEPGPASPLLTSKMNLTSGDPILVAGSTHDPEETILATAVKALRANGYPNLRLVLVPRHVQRAEEIAAAVAPILGPSLRWSAVKSDGAVKLDPLRPLIVDTVGELADFYRIATAAFVGGSLGNDRGGQNMLEPAALGISVLHGPSVPNFSEAAACLQAARASAIVADAPQLADAIASLLRDPDERRSQAARGRAALDPHRGASGRTLDELVKRGFLVVP